MAEISDNALRIATDRIVAAILGAACLRQTGSTNPEDAVSAYEDALQALRKRATPIKP
jgi:hypothetical protein